VTWNAYDQIVDKTLERIKEPAIAFPVVLDRVETKES
jgi:hypothetical protein